MCLLLLILAMPGRAEDLEVSVAANSMTTEEWSSWAGASITWSEPSTKYSTMLQVQALADFLRKELSNETRTFVTTFPAPPLWKETDGAAVTLPLITKLMLWKTNGKLYQSPARVHTNACASCVYLGLTSTVSTGACWTTLLGCGDSYYDEDGEFHVHDCNTTTCNGSCSRRHSVWTSYGPRVCDICARKRK